MKRTSYNLPNHAHYLTFSCYRRQKLLIDDKVRRSLLQLWDEVRQKEQVGILAYVIMPEHVHLLLFPRDEHYNISQILRRLKEPFTRWLVDHWQSKSPHLLKRIEASHGSRKVNRFWQAGGGYDRNVFSERAICRAIDYIELNPVRRGLVSDPLDWTWSSARARREKSDAILMIDDLESLAWKLG